MERHLYVTEVHCPIGSISAVIFVGGDRANADTNTIPSPLIVRAFYMDGTEGVMFHQGVWHSLDCYPVNRSHVDFLNVSDSKTEDEIEAIEGPVSGRRTQVIDFSRSDGLCFELIDKSFPLP